jgi:hypothetical protein
MTTAIAASAISMAMPIAPTTIRCRLSAKLDVAEAST